MSTRGYFKIINGEGTTDLKKVYQKTGDILVEAHHDGYLMDMLRDILVIPFQLARIQSMGFGKRFVSMQFFPESVYPKEWLEKHPERGIKDQDLDWVLDTNEAIGFYDLMWSDVLSLLHFTSFGKYADIQEGVVRYGYPVTMDDIYFVTNLNCDSRIDWLEISDIDFQGDGESIEEDRQNIQSMIDDLNKHITHDEFKIVFDRQAEIIRMSITGIAVNLMYDAAKSGKVIDPHNLAR